MSRGGASAVAGTTAVGCPSALGPEPSVSHFVWDVPPAFSTTLCRAESRRPPRAPRFELTPTQAVYAATQRGQQAFTRWHAVWKKLM